MIGQTFRHRKRGSLVRVLGVEFARTTLGEGEEFEYSISRDGEDALHTSLSNPILSRRSLEFSLVGRVQGEIEKDQMCLIYLELGDGNFWLRSLEEFLDGRFEQVAS